MNMRFRIQTYSNILAHERSGILYFMWALHVSVFLYASLYVRLSLHNYYLVNKFCYVSWLLLKIDVCLNIGNGLQFM